MKTIVTAAHFCVVMAASIVSFNSPRAFANAQNAAKVNPLSAESITARVDRLFADWNKPDSPGWSLAVSKDGVLVYEHGYGMGNLELGIFVRDGKLMASENAFEGEGVELTAVSTNRFVILGTTIEVEFVSATGRRGQELRVTGAGPKPIVSQKLETFSPLDTQLRVYVGEYTSPEIEVTYMLTSRDSVLLIHMPGRGDIVLLPILPDTFARAWV
jgi:hypothetical protein